MAGWKVTTPAAEVVISTADAKAWLKVDTSDDDALIAALVASAAETAQNYLSQALVTQTITETFDAWGDVAQPSLLRLAIHPVISVTSITYIDDNGATQTLAANQYNVDLYAKRCVIEPAYNVSWPTVRVQRNAITVVYQAGYGAATALPKDIRTALLLMVADGYENRTDSVKQLPTASKYLLDRVNYAYLL